jgi:hypothetical protein
LAPRLVGDQQAGEHASMVEASGTRSLRSWVLAVGVAFASDNAVAQESAPSAAPAAKWSGQLADVANPSEARLAVKVLRHRPPADQLALLGEALQAREVLADAALRERVLQVVASFPEHASALVPAFLVAVPKRSRDAKTERRSAGAFAFVAAAWPRANVAQLKELESWLQAEVRGARWSHPEDRPWLQLWAQVAIAAVERDDTLQPLDRQRSLGRKVSERETGWALAEALLQHASGPAVAAWKADRLQGEEWGVANLRSQVVEQLAEWRLSPPLAASLAGSALLLAHFGDEPLARSAAALWLADPDPANDARAKQLLLRDPPEDDRERAFVVAVAGHAGPELQRAVLGWISRGVLDVRLLDVASGCSSDWTASPGIAFSGWQLDVWIELARAVGTRSSVREQQRCAPPPETLLAVGPDTGIERLLEVLARLEGIRKGDHEQSSREALWGDVPWLDREGVIVVDVRDDAALDAVLRALPPAPSGLVPRLCRIVLDRDGGDLRLARTCARALLLAARERPSPSVPVLGRRTGRGTPMVVVGPQATWQQLAELARAAEKLEGPDGLWLARGFEQAAAEIGKPHWPLATAPRQVNGPPSRDDRWEPLDPLGWLAFQGQPIWEGLKDAFEGPSPLFTAVQLHRRDIDGLPAIEYTLRPAEPAPR